MYRLNVDVDSRNSLMLDALAPQYSIQAIDAVAGTLTSQPYLTKEQTLVASISVLKLAIGARVMLQLMLMYQMVLLMVPEVK